MPYYQLIRLFWLYLCIIYARSLYVWASELTRLLPERFANLLSFLNPLWSFHMTVSWILDIQCHLVCVDTVLIFSVNSEIAILVMM